MAKFNFILTILPFIFTQSIFGQLIDDNLNDAIAPELGPLPVDSNSNSDAVFVNDLLNKSEENSRQKRALNKLDPSGFQQFLNSNPQLKSFLKDLVANGDKHLSTAFEKLTERIPKGKSTMPPPTEATSSVPSSTISATTELTTTSNPSSSSGKPPAKNDAEIMKQFMAFTFLDMAKGFFEKPDKKKGGGGKN